MQKRKMLIIVTMVLMATVLGCQPKSSQKTGFLSDYSRLEVASKTSMRYVDTRALGKYSSFIVDPVGWRVYSESMRKIKPADLADMTNYMHTAIVNELSKDYRIAYRPGPGIARIRVAITDLKKSTAALNVLPPNQTDRGRAWRCFHGS